MPRSWKPGWGQHRPPPTPGHPGSPQGKVEVVVFIRLGTRQVWGAEWCLLAGGGLLVPSCIASTWDKRHSLILFALLCSQCLSTFCIQVSLMLGRLDSYSGGGEYMDGRLFWPWARTMVDTPEVDQLCGRPPEVTCRDKWGSFPAGACVHSQCEGSGGGRGLG